MLNHAACANVMQPVTGCLLPGQQAHRPDQQMLYMRTTDLGVLFCNLAISHWSGDFPPTYVSIGDPCLLSDLLLTTPQFLVRAGTPITGRSLTAAALTRVLPLSKLLCKSTCNTVHTVSRCLCMPVSQADLAACCRS